jgi:excisionase family DNA binding protein
MIQLPEKQLFRPDEVRDLMRLKTVETVHGWIRAGKIKYVLTPGGQKRIPRAEVERITREMQERP